MAKTTIDRRQDAERERNERYDAILRQPRVREASHYSLGDCGAVG
jgi:hypothetical protein